MRQVRFLDLRAAYDELAAEIDAAVHRVLASGRYVLGPEVEQFEAEFARYVGARHCVGVGNGLDALRLALQAMDVGPGHEVIVPANTYIATWLAVSAVGADPIPVEPDPDTCNIDPDRIEASITGRTRAIVPVHLYGRPAPMDEIRPLASRYGLSVLEDAAQAHGASLAGARVGTLGRAAAWSFFPSKNLGALGDGGAVTTDDDALADRLRLLRNYGSRQKYVHEAAGGNSRLDELQAAVLTVKLAHLDEWNARRRRVAERYLEGLAGRAVGLPGAGPGSDAVWHLFVVRSDHRDALQRHLAHHGVETLVHYAVPPYRQGAYAGRTEQMAPLPVSDGLHRRVLSLPMGPHLTDDAVDQVIAAVREFPGASAGDGAAVLVGAGTGSGG